MLAVRAEALAAMDAEIERFADAKLDEALEQARSAVWVDVTSRAENCVRQVNFTPPEVMPALVLAYDYYGDAAREAEIAVRNNARHAVFVPAVPLKLLIEAPLVRVRFNLRHIASIAPRIAFAHTLQTTYLENDLVDR